ncbi:MAG: aminopeptidase [Frankiaceae bacterium]|nr:aminopeptidase [Frankiaceae bacterium]
MAGNNLTRDEAQRRAALIEVHATTAELDLTTSETTFRSTSTVTFTARDAGVGTFVEVAAVKLHEATLNGKPLPAHAFEQGRLRLDELATENELRVVADIAYSRTGEGLHRFVDPVDGGVYLYTQFETYDAHGMYACFDQPDLKTTFSLTVIAPDDWQVVSNEQLSVTAEPVRDGVARWVFTTTPRMSTYITALVAGPYHRVDDSVRSRDGRDIPMAVYCRASLAEFLDADEIFEVTKQGFAFYEEKFDYAYPFSKYDQLFVPEFNAGAMENAGCVTILEDYVFRSKTTAAAYERRAETVLHELAHMWFGDLVTMQWWDDLWLNESFATYASVLCQSEVTKYTSAWTTFANVEKTWAYRQDQLPSTHPIAADIPDMHAVEVNFDGITYAKGASVLKQLVSWVGRDAFFEGLRHYFRDHEWGNTTLQDLLSALETASGRDLSAWSKEWLETAGANILRAVVTDDGSAYSSFQVHQSAASPEHPTLRSHRVAIGLYDKQGEQLVRRQSLELDVVGAVTEVPALVGQPLADVVLVNDEDLTYAKIRLDERSLETVRTSIGGFTDSLPRAQCWSAAWDMLRDAELAARDYLTLVLSGIGAESDIGVVQSLLRQVKLALDVYADPAFRPIGMEQLASAAVSHLRSTDPGSDHQLAWARAFATAATTDEHLDLVRGLLDGTSSVPGLAIDTDLRWSLLARLSATGRASEGDIDAELARDATSAGERHAATCRASMPSPEAKAAAWDAVVVQGDLPNAVQGATIAGFQQPDQLELLQPYIERYFLEVRRVWSSRTSAMAQQIVEGLFPTLHVSESTVEAVDECLAAGDVPPALSRLLNEGKSGLERALRARERDAAAE